MPDTLDLCLLAAKLSLSYDEVQRNWRAWVRAEGFPPPYRGAGKGQRPRWLNAAVEAWQRQRSGLEPQTPAADRAPAAALPANDPTPAPPARPRDRVSKLLAAAGG